MDTDSQLIAPNQPDDIEQKARKIFKRSVLTLMPLVFISYLVFKPLLGASYDGTAWFLMQYAVPILLLPMLGTMLFWCFIQVKKGITGRPLLAGQLSRQPFLFLGTVLFLILGVVCAGLIAWIIWLFFFIHA